MEYLSLQDIPHRQYDPLQSRRAAPSERQVGSMADAVSHDKLSCDPSRPLPPSPHSFRAPPTCSRRISSQWDGQLSHMALPLPNKRARPSSVHEDYDHARRPSNARRGSFFWKSAFQDEEVEVDTFSNAIEDDLRRYSILTASLIRKQTHYMRNSPPLQPGETGSKLPSFSEAFSEVRL